MKLSSLNQRDRRAVTIGGLILGVSLAFVFVVKPYFATLSSTRQEISDEQDLLVRERGLATHLPSLPSEKANASRQLVRESARMFNAEDDLIATGNLADYITSVGNTAGITMQQTETRPALPVVKGVQALQVEVHAAGDITGILQFLRQLETGNKLVRVGRLVIERGRQLTGQTGGTPSAPAANASPSGPEVLSLNASVYGYRINDASLGALDSSTVGAPSPYVRATADLPSLTTVIDHDPFDPSRQHPQVVTGPPPVKEPPLELVGTVISSAGNSFAICQKGDDTQVVYPGSKFGGYTLNTLSRGHATFVTPSGGRLELEAPQPDLGQ